MVGITSIPASNRFEIHWMGRGVNYDKVGAGLIPSRGWLVLHCPP